MSIFTLARSQAWCLNKLYSISSLLSDWLAIVYPLRIYFVIQTPIISTWAWNFRFFLSQIFPLKKQCSHTPHILSRTLITHWILPNSCFRIFTKKVGFRLILCYPIFRAQRPERNKQKHIFRRWLGFTLPFVTPNSTNLPLTAVHQFDPCCTLKLHAK